LLQDAASGYTYSPGELFLGISGIINGFLCQERYWG
jgi:hypothetical protein